MRAAKPRRTAVPSTPAGTAAEAACRKVCRAASATPLPTRLTGREPDGARPYRKKSKTSCASPGSKGT